MPSISTNLGEPANIYLSQADVDFLISDKSVDSRLNVLHKIAANYSSGYFQDREQLFAEQIFRVLMQDTELRVREKLALQLQNADVPRDIILHMAKDVEQVSIPVLQSSHILSDADLIDLVETSRELTKLIAISQRDRLSARVSDALVETHYPQVVTSLLENNGAIITPDNYEQIISEFSREQSVTAAMANRAELPLPIVEKLIRHVSDSIAAQLEAKYPLDALAQQQVRESMTLDLASNKRSDAELHNLVTHMIAENKLTPSLILSALCRGQLRFFEIALATVADIPDHNARRLIYDKGPLGFRAIYDKTGLPESMFDAVRLVIMVVNDLQSNGMEPGNAGYSNGLVERVLQHASGKQIDNLPYIIALIRQS